MVIFMEMIETQEERLLLEQVFRTYRNLMFHVANEILNNEHDAEDAVQQAFFAIMKNIKKISDVKCPKTRNFVVTIVERKSIDLYRAKQRNGVLPLDEYVNTPDGSEMDAIADRAVLSKAIAMLPPKYRELILLKYDSGYSEHEIAAIFGMTRANVNKTLQRARRKLETILTGQEA